MDRYVWVQDGDDEPAWTAGGSYHVVRVIRMLVEFWDRTRLSEQEALIGRRKDTGAPLDGEVETDVPDYAADPDGEVTPLDAHIRLANPRTPATEDDLIFRAGLSFSRGFDGGGQLDQGLAFVSFQRRHGAVPQHPGAAGRRAARGVHPPRGRRLLLRPAGRRPRPTASWARACSPEKRWVRPAPVVGTLRPPEKGGGPNMNDGSPGTLEVAGR